MAIFRNYNAGARAIAPGVAQTVVWNSSDIPGTGVSAYHIDMTGAGNDFANVTRVRIKAAGQTIWDVNGPHIQSMIQRLGRSNLAPAAADTNFVLPLYKEDYGDNEGMKFLGGFPRGLAPTLEIDVDAAVAAGNAFCGWSQSDQPFAFYTKYIGSQTNIAAGVVNGRVPLTQDGIIRGISINSVGLLRLKIQMSGVQLMNLSAAQIQAYQRLENTAVVVDPVFIPIEFPFAAVGGDSYFEIDTQGGVWVGPTNEITVYSVLANS